MQDMPCLTELNNSVEGYNCPWDWASCSDAIMLCVLDTCCVKPWKDVHFLPHVWQVYGICWKVFIAIVRFGVVFVERHAAFISP
jgi:hypothetical protein